MPYSAPIQNFPSGTTLFGPGTTALLFASLLFGAVAFGLVAASANPVLFAIALGALVGTMLLAKPSWNITLILALGLLVAGLLPIWFDAYTSKASWGVSLLTFTLLGATLFTLLSQPESARNTPAFVWLAALFFLYAIATTLLQWYSAPEFLGAFKRYFQASGLLFALTWLRIPANNISRWRSFLLVVALLQLPFALYELIYLVPIRQRFVAFDPGLVPIDIVSGTFGGHLYGGGANAEMATFLILVLGFLLARFREKQLRLKRLLLIAPFLLIPLFLGETKIVVILLPMLFLVLYRRELVSRPHYAIIALVVAAILTFSAATAYVAVTKKQSLDSLIETTLRYNVYEKGYGGNYLNRTTVLTFWADRQGAHNPVSMLLGNGLGSSHDGTNGHVAMEYPRHGIGLTAASTILWDLGAFGALLFLSILLTAWWTADKLQQKTQQPWVRADAAAIQASLPIFAVYLVYRLALLETLSFQIVFSSLIGYLAWLHRNHSQAPFGRPE